MTTPIDSEAIEDSLSERFCAADHDIVLISNDRVSFDFYRRNIKVHSEGLLRAHLSDVESPGTACETLLVDETSKTLDLLLQFMSRQLPPSLCELPFADIAALAEAAEKYRVYAALPACRDFMWQTLPEHSLDVLTYAFKHRYRELADRAAPFTIKIPSEDIIKALPNIFTPLLLPWIRYRETWNAVFVDACGSFWGAMASEACDSCSKLYGASSVVLKMKGQPGLLQDLDLLCADLCTCPWTSTSARTAWVSDLKMKVDAIKNFSSLTEDSSWIQVLDSSSLDLSNAPHPAYDIILQSSDGVDFPFFRDNLAVHSEIFGGADAIGPATGTPNTLEIVPLGESSQTLKLLLQFMSIEPQPNLSLLPFPSLADLAEAVEKYEVYTALGPCKKQMQRFIPTYPLPILGFATRHGHTLLADEAATLLAGLPSVTIFQQLNSLPMNYALAWTSYRESWTSALATACRTLVESCSLECLDSECVVSVAGIIAAKLGGDVASLLDIDSICDFAIHWVGDTVQLGMRKKMSRHVEMGPCCSKCTIRVHKWRDQTKEMIQGIPKLSSYL
ncbi:hypothetical protein PLICRDRAFT_669491 [Plicaturopsis crispa FD-325 SS-3]|uniref:BTB domain-containing protein n=1 Tax=Plicaturopsis crispa FD-325 SS-3 TaxID=944288 RepID=A0A0C9SYT0_PLICR|nr:hypothetical protein PLICRDRAFT_669491 [Plicaturopsis crispa FD-325 SS-3]